MTDKDVAGWAFDVGDGAQWAAKADSREAALEIFNRTAPSRTSVPDERSIPRADAGRYRLEDGRAVAQNQAK